MEDGEEANRPLERGEATIHAPANVASFSVFEKAQLFVPTLPFWYAFSLPKLTNVCQETVDSEMGLFLRYTHVR